MRRTSTVMMATVIIRFVAILHSNQFAIQKSVRGEKVMKYLRAIPLSVLTLRSTYPSLSNMVALVC